MRDASLEVGEDHWTDSNAIAHSDIPAFIATLIKRANGEELPHGGWVPEASFWIVDVNDVVGDVQIRPTLNERYQQFGGNIGYFVHPHHRGKGIATFALREGLRILQSLGVREPLVTCSDDNAASIRVIERCGGIRIGDSKLTGPRRRRYKFCLSDPPLKN